MHGQKRTGSNAGQRAGRGKRRGESFVETTNILAPLREKSKQSLVKWSHPGTFQAGKHVGTTVSGRRQVCPAWGLPSQAALLNRALYGNHLPTWCSQAPALSALPRLPHSLVSNHTIGSDQLSPRAAFTILPVCTSLSPSTQPTSPTVLSRACPGPYT